jgi:hypothetical protein
MARTSDFIAQKNQVLSAQITNRAERDKLKMRWNELITEFREVTKELEEELNWYK